MDSAVNALGGACFGLLVLVLALWGLGFQREVVKTQRRLLPPGSKWDRVSGIALRATRLIAVCFGALILILSLWRAGLLLLD